MADEKNKTTYGILAILIGWLGIHKFYVGDKKHGIIHLILGVCGLFIGITLLISAIMAIISGVKALTMEQEEFEKRYIEEMAFV